MEDEASLLDRQVGERIKAGRRSRGWTLDDFAAASGVSRAMISRVERGESSATAALLARLAAALGVTLASLFAEPAPGGGPLLRSAEQPTWRDPATGYLRRAVSPAATGSPVELVEVEFPPRATVRFEPWQPGRSADQHVWVLEGRIDVTVGETTHALGVGDCLHMSLGAPITYHNPTRRAARYAVVLARAADGRP
jgi:transcriptional regulator with XRE-family HTH domain